MSLTERNEPGFSASGALFSSCRSPLDILKQVYGYSSFRGKQQKVVEH
ncbi:ATP-dependent DNA helicase RecQ, partial [Rhizobium ruizarguesonis]